MGSILRKSKGGCAAEVEGSGVPGSEARGEAARGVWARRAREAVRGEPSLLEKEMVRKGCGDVGWRGVGKDLGVLIVQMQRQRQREGKGERRKGGVAADAGYIIVAMSD